MKQATWWWVSIAVSAILVAVLVQLWSLMNRYEIEPVQLVSEQAVDAYLAENRQASHQGGTEDLIPFTRIPTGIFIQSLKFFNSIEVNLTGYIWQRYTNGINDAIKPGKGEVGFILPEQVGTGTAPREIYRIQQGDEEVIGWYFEATLRQPFEYFFYPFDHKTVWVRLWPKDFAGSTVLVPDFQAYRATGPEDVFGIENEIVLGAWERENTYFDFKPTCYDTNFGINGYVGQEGFPELYYNFVINRKSGDAFIMHLLPLFLVATLLFSALLTVTAKPDLAETHGFNTSGVLGTCSVLFFVVLLAQIQLRGQFAGSAIVYMEYFYFLMYAVLVVVAANTYIFSMRAAPQLKFVHYADNFIPKLLYWPVLLLCMIAVTTYVLWGVGPAQERLLGECVSPAASSLGHEQREFEPFAAASGIALSSPHTERVRSDPWFMTEAAAISQSQHRLHQWDNRPRGLR
jgi:hypothetical protein